MTKLRLIAMQEEHKYKISQGRNEIFKKTNTSVPQNNADMLNDSLIPDFNSQQNETKVQPMDMESQVVNLNSNSAIVNNEVTNAIFGPSIDAGANPGGIFENPISQDSIKIEDPNISQPDTSQNDILGGVLTNVPFKEPVMGSAEKSKEISDDAFISLINSIRNEIDLKLDGLRSDFHKGLDRLQEDFLQKSGASLVTTSNGLAETAIINENPENLMGVSNGFDGMTNSFDPQATMVVPVADINAAREMVDNSVYKTVA